MKNRTCRRRLAWICRSVVSVSAVILMALFARPVSGQQAEPEIVIPAADDVQELVLTDGTTVFGRVVEVGDPFRFTLVSGAEMSVATSSVRSLRIAEGTLSNGEFWFEDPNRTRLFFAPTATSVGQGRGYFAVYELFIPFVTVGVTDWLTLSGGTPLLVGVEGRPFWFAPKLTFYSGERVDAAVGVLAVTAEGEDAGLLYGVATRRGDTGSVTLGLGYGYVNGDLASNPAVVLGGTTRVGRGVALVTENYLFPGGSGLISFGPRFMGERFSFDLGLVWPIVDDSSIALPLINFVYNF